MNVLVPLDVGHRILFFFQLEGWVQTCLEPFTDFTQFYDFGIKMSKRFFQYLDELSPLIQTHFTTFQPLNHHSEPSTLILYNLKPFILKKLPILLTKIKQSPQSFDFSSEALVTILFFFFKKEMENFI